MINAFSLPGGPVYIGEGMLDQMETEDELASILAHEVEHIDHYHCIERMQIDAKLKNLNLEIIGALLQVPLEFWQAGYHKDEEFEADREGVRLAVDSGLLALRRRHALHAPGQALQRIRHSRAQPRRRTLRTSHPKPHWLLPFAPPPPSA